MLDTTGLTITSDAIGIGTVNGGLGFPTTFTYVSTPDALVPSIADLSALTPPDMKPLYAQFIAQATYQNRW